MESAGYVVKGFGSAEEFLESGSTRDAACLIVDVQLPGITGLELQDKLGGARLSCANCIRERPGNWRKSREGDQAGRGRFSCQTVPQGRFAEHNRRGDPALSRQSQLAPSTTFDLHVSVWSGGELHGNRIFCACN